MFRGMRECWSVARAAWSEDKKREKVSRNRDELDFLPAAVEVLETPASPAGRIFALFIAFMFLAALVWGWFAQIDTVAVAQGKIIPGDRVKVIQPLEIGVIRAIHVRDGQAVKKDQVLIELDPTDSGADQVRLAHSLVSRRLDAARLTAMAEKPDDPLSVFVAPPDTPAPMVSAARTLMRAEAAEYREANAGTDAEIRQKDAETATVRAQIAAYRDTIPLIRKRVDAWEYLTKKEYASRLRLTELQEQLVTRQRSLTVEQRRLSEIAEAISVLRRRKAERAAAFAGRVSRELSEAMSEAVQYEQELNKVRERLRARVLRSPVDGVVQQMQVNTVGGVVNPAERLMVVVPADVTLEVEAMVLNKDIGFVRAGQDSEIKIESFPFTKYGLIDGTVKNISADAVEDEKQGLIYPMRVTLKTNRILVGDRWVPLAPGMSVTAEVKTGKRRAIEFFLSPLMRYQDEALRER